MADAFPKLNGFRVYCDESNTDDRKAHPVYGEPSSSRWTTFVRFSKNWQTGDAEKRCTANSNGRRCMAACA